MPFRRPSKKNNKKIRVLFQMESISVPYVISYWTGLVSDYSLEESLVITSQIFNTNEMREMHLS